MRRFFDGLDSRPGLSRRSFFKGLIGAGAASGIPIFLRDAEAAYARFPGLLEPLGSRSADGSLFTDVTEASGIIHYGHGKCVVMADFTRDGRLDVYLSIVYGENRLYMNRGEMRFADITRGSHVGDPNDAHGIVAADFDNDGFLEIFVANNVELASQMRGRVSQPNNFFKADRELTYVDRAVAAGVSGGAINYSCGVTTADVTGNGYLDLFVAKGGYRSGMDAADSLYINNGNGTFTDIAAEIGLNDHGNGYACAFCDYDNDGRPDLVVAGLNSTLDGKTLALYRNESSNGVVRFRDVTEELGLRRNGYTVSLFWGDTTNSGYQDLFLGNSRGIGVEDEKYARNQLFRNNGDGTFTDVSEESGVSAAAGNTRGVTMGDVNNDGYIDIYVTNSRGDAQLLINDGSGRFTDQAASLGGNVWYGHGCALGDLDGSGDLDLIVGNWRSIDFDSDGQWRVFKNNTNNDAYLKVNVEGTISNRSGVMTKVAIYEEGRAGQRDRLVGYREITAGNGTFPGNPLQAHFGLGPHTRVDLVATFPSGRQVTMQRVDRGQMINVVEPA